MRHLRFWINFLLIVLPLGVLCLGAYRFERRIFGYLNSDARLAATLSAEASRMLKREVRIGDVHFTDNLWSLSAHNILALSDVWIAESPNAPGNYFAHADKVIVHYQISQLIDNTDSKLPLVDEIQLIGPQLTLQRDPKGRWNYEDLPPNNITRPYWDKLTFSNGRLTLNDLAFPSPSAKPLRRLSTTLTGLVGTALIRPDKTIAFDVAGIPEAEYARDFRVIGIVKPQPFRASAHLLASRVNLPFFVGQIVPPGTARVTSGLADLDLSALYAPAPNAPSNGLQWQYLDAHGAVQLLGVTANGPQLGAPLENVSGSLTFVDTALNAKLTGRYAGLPLSVNGSILGFQRWTELIPTEGRKLTLPPLTMALDIATQNTDFIRAYHLLQLDRRLTVLPAIVRTALQTGQAQGSANLRLLGPLDNPTASLTAHLNSLQYDTYHAQNVDGRLLYAQKAVHVTLHGGYAGGIADIRARIEPDRNGAFLIEAHGRGLHLDSLDASLPQLKGGTGDLDIALQGERNKTPNISAQAQILDLNVNGQTLHSLYARAETVGRNLVVRTLRAEDPRGFALASGSVDLQQQTLALNIEADQLDLEALSRTLMPPAPPGKGDPNAPGTPTGAALPLSGLGYLRHGAITGKWDHPQLSGRLSLYALKAGNDPLMRLDKVVADVRLSRSALIVSQGTAERYPSLVQFSGLITEPFALKPEVSFDIAARSLDLGTLLAAAKVDPTQFAVTGTLSTDVPIHIGGTLDALRLEGARDVSSGQRPFAIRLQDAAINGLPITEALAQATYDAQGLHLVHAEAKTAGGAVTASGELSREGKLALTLSGDNLAVEQLLTALPEESQPGLKAQLAPLTGHVFVTAKVSGETTAPILNDISLKSQDLTYNGFSVGPFQTHAGYAGKTVTLRDLTVADPGSKAAVLIVPELDFNTETRALHTPTIGSANGVRLVNLPIQRIFDLYLHLPDPASGKPRTLPPPVTTILGALTAQVALSGTADDPRADLVLREEDNQNIHVYNDYLIPSFGGKATLTKNGVSGSQVALSIRPLKPMPSTGAGQDTSQEAYVVAPQFSISSTGVIAADVTVSKLNLAFVQQALNLDPANPLSGQGKFINITASGKLDSPELDISTVLEQIVYRKQKIDRLEVSHAKVKEGLIDIADLYITRNGTAMHPQTDGYITGRITGFTWEAPYVPDAAVLDFTAQLPRLPKSTVPNTRTRAQQAQSWADLSLLSEFGLSLSDDSQGTFLVNAKVAGTRAKPILTGSVDIYASRIKAQNLATGLGTVDGTLRLDNDRLTVERFSAESQIVGKNNVLRSGGSLTLAGSLPLGLGDTPLRPGPDPLTLTLTRFPFAEKPIPGSQGGGVSGDADGSLRILGSLLDPLITGQITFSNTTAALPTQFAELAAGGFKPPINPRFRAVRLVLGSKFQLVSSELNTSADGYVQLDGSLTNPRLAGRLSLNKGVLQLGLTRFDILPPGIVTIDYPRSGASANTAALRGAGQDNLSVDVDLRARAKRITATSLSGIRKNYEVTVTAKGSLTDTQGESFTGRPRMALHFETIPGDLAIGDEGIMAALAPSLIGVDSFNQVGRDPGGAFTSILSNAFIGGVLPGQFDRITKALNLDQFSIDYDPIQHLSLTISRQLVGPLYFTYIRSLSGPQELYDLKFSLRFRDRYQVSYDLDEQHTQRFLVEGVWRF